MTLKSAVNAQKEKKTMSPIYRATDGLMNGPTNRRTDQQMDRPPNIVGYRVACKRLEKTEHFAPFFKNVRAS